MKKFLAVIMTFMLCAGFMTLSAFAADSATVYVTISNAGTLAATQEAVTVTDIDGDGTLTIDDALYCAHEALYSGGAAEGYGTEDSDWGLSLAKLWGVENGGSYGYYVNNVASNGLTDEVSDGDYLYAFVYSDLSTWSDTYSFFDVNSVSVTADDSLALTLSGAGYDENWNSVTLAMEGATITIDGTATDYVTDADGSVTINFDEAGTYLVSATSDSSVLVPPVCIVTVTAAESAEAEESADTEETTETETEETSDSPQTGYDYMLWVVLAAIASPAVAVYAIKKTGDRA